MKQWPEQETHHAWLNPGQHNALCRHIPEREGRIHFAGEHTSLNHTWMQGTLEPALRSGGVHINVSNAPCDARQETAGVFCLQQLPKGRHGGGRNAPWRQAPQFPG